MFNDAMHSIKFKSVNWAKVVKELEKLYSEYNEKNNPELYASMGGEIKSEVYDKEPMLAKNACALKLCLALEKAGFYIPNGTSNTLKAANGKSYFVSAKYFFEFLSSNDGVYTREYRNPKHLFNSFKTGIYYQGERLDGKAGAHIDARYNGKGGRMYEQFKTNYGLYW